MIGLVRAEVSKAIGRDMHYTRLRAELNSPRLHSSDQANANADKPLVASKQPKQLSPEKLKPTDPTVEKFFCH